MQYKKYKINKKIIVAKNVTDAIKKFKDIQEMYVYQFPELTDEDISKAKQFELVFVKKLPGGDIVLKGTLNNLKVYADQYLDYKLVPDYLSKEKDYKDSAKRFVVMAGNSPKDEFIVIETNDFNQATKMKKQYEESYNYSYIKDREE